MMEQNFQLFKEILDKVRKSRNLLFNQTKKQTIK